MVRIESDSARIQASTWECPRCGRSNRERDHVCPNCRLPRRGGPRERTNQSEELPAHPALRRSTPPGPQAVVTLSHWRDQVLCQEARPPDEAEALTALAAVLTHYERWQAATHGAVHRFHVGTAYLALVPGDALLLEAFRFEAATLVLERLRSQGRTATARAWEVAKAVLERGAEPVGADE